MYLARIKNTWLTLSALCSLSGAALALPEAHLLRVDPRAGLTAGSPMVTTLIEVGEFKSVGEALSPCASVRNQDASFDCMANALERPGSLWTAFQFPEGSAKLGVRVENADMPATFVSKLPWKDAVGQPGMGTAWLIALDASSGMGSARYQDARFTAEQFVKDMGKADIGRLIIFDDRASTFSADSKWRSYAERAELIKTMQGVPNPVSASASGKPLFDTVKNVIRTGFNDLGNTNVKVEVPLHQAFVLLSNGAGRKDAATGSVTGEQLKQIANNGRFPDDNKASPKTPLPIISVLFPNPKGSLVNDAYATSDVGFMESMANPEVGGFFSVVRAGQGKARGEAIVKAVKSRFNNMWVVKWKVACLNPTIEQSFTLGFTGMKQTINPDGRFKDVPLGVDPTTWPLDVYKEQTVSEANSKPVTPGGTFRVYGNFCWGASKERAESYFVPPGTKAAGSDIESGRRMMQELVAQGMRGAAVAANGSFVEFQVPDDDRFIEGTGDNAVARIIVVDSRANRASGTDEKSILTLHAKKKGLPLLVWGVVAAGVLMLVAAVWMLMAGKRG